MAYHGRIQLCANKIFQSEHKPCISVYLQLGGAHFKNKQEVEEHNGTLNVSLFGVERYNYQGIRREQLEMLARFSFGSMNANVGGFEDSNLVAHRERWKSSFYLPESIQEEEEAKA